MAKAPVIVYDKDLNPVTDLEAAKNLSYTLRANQVSKASFDLPADNEKNDLIEGRFFAEIFDNGDRVGMFRINKKTPENQGNSAGVTYTCKHVLDTLNDKRIQSTVEKTGETTALQWLIDQQETAHWQLGDVEFDKGLTYKFKRQTLLDAFLTVPDPWWEEYDLEYDTESYPWTIHVRKPDTTPQATLQYHKNLNNISQTVDWEQLVTRVYARGKGSGEDQVTAGPFEQRVDDWGVIEGEFQDRFFDNATDLEDAALKFLDRASNPRVDYNGNASDFYTLFGTNEITLGDYVTVYDATLGIDVKVKVVQLKKQSVQSKPGEIQLSLNNRRKLKPDWGVLAYEDKADERSLASSSVGGGAGGALKSGGTGTNELADEAVSWDKVQFKTDDGYFEQSLMKINSIVTFENDFTEIDKLDDGDTYAKMRKEWRAAEDITKIAGGEIYTDSIILDSIDFSPTDSKDIIGQINTHYSETLDAQVLKISGQGVEVNADDQLTLKTSGRMQIDADDQLDIYGPNILISALDPEGTKQAVNDDPETVVIAGENIELDGDTTVYGSFEVQGENVTLDADTTIDGNLNFEGVNYIKNIYRVANENYFVDMDSDLTLGTLDRILAGGWLDMNSYDIENIGTVTGIDLTDLDAADHGNLTGGVTVSAHHDPYEQVDTILSAGDNILLESDGENVTIHVSGVATELDELGDVSLDGPSDGEVLQHDGSNWVDAALSHSEITDVSASQHHSKYTDSEAVSAVESTDIDLGLNNLDADTIRADTEFEMDGYAFSLDSLELVVGNQLEGPYDIQTENSGTINGYIITQSPWTQDVVGW